MPITNPLKISEELKAGAVTHEQAVAIANSLEEVAQNLHEVLKKDITLSEQRLEAKITAVDAKIDASEQRLDAKIDGIKEYLNTKIMLLMWSVVLLFGVNFAFLGYLASRLP